MRYRAHASGARLARLDLLATADLPAPLDSLATPEHPLREVELDLPDLLDPLETLEPTETPEELEHPDLLATPELACRRRPDPLEDLAPLDLPAPMELPDPAADLEPLDPQVLPDLPDSPEEQETPALLATRDRTESLEEMERTALARLARELQEELLQEAELATHREEPPSPEVDHTPREESKRISSGTGRASSSSETDKDLCLPHAFCVHLQRGIVIWRHSLECARFE